MNRGWVVEGGLFGCLCVGVEYGDVVVSMIVLLHFINCQDIYMEHYTIYVAAIYIYHFDMYDNEIIQLRYLL